MTTTAPTDKAKAKDVKADARQVRPFADVLQEQNRGRTHRELSDLLNELVGAVVETGKAGEIALKIKVKPAGKGDTRTVLVTDEIKSKIPTPDRAESIFFATSDGNLTRSDPRQTRLPLRGVGDEDPADVEDNTQAAGGAQ